MKKFTLIAVALLLVGNAINASLYSDAKKKAKSAASSAEKSASSAASKAGSAAKTGASAVGTGALYGAEAMSAAGSGFGSTAGAVGSMGQY